MEPFTFLLHVALEIPFVAHDYPLLWRAATATAVTKGWIAYWNAVCLECSISDVNRVIGSTIDSYLHRRGEDLRLHTAPYRARTGEYLTRPG